MKMFGIAIVFGLDLALLVWDNYAADPHKARSEGQRNVGLIMIVANMLGIGAAMVADAARILDPAGNKELIYTVSVYGMAAVVLVNIAGGIIVNQLDPDRAEKQAAAEHDRQIARMRTDHERRMRLADTETELGVSEYRNMSRIRSARQKYYIDDDGDGIPDRVSDTPPMQAYAAEGDLPAPKARRNGKV
jgi:hypothetical protein